MEEGQSRKTPTAMGLLEEAREVPGRGDSSLLFFSRAAVLHRT